MANRVESKARVQEDSTTSGDGSIERQRSLTGMRRLDRTEMKRTRIARDSERQCV